MTRTLDPASPTWAQGRAGASLVVMYASYLALLIWIVLWKLEIPWFGGVDRVIKLVPFVPDAGEGASTVAEVVVNLLLFVPFGLYVGLFAPSWRWWKVAATVAGASLGLELTQYALAIGSSDVTDVIVNTAGGLVGFGLLALARRRLAGRTDAVLTRVCAVVTVVGVVACAAFIALPVHYAPPPGGPGLSSR